MIRKQEIQTRLAQLGGCPLAEAEFLSEAETDIRYLLEQNALLEKKLKIALEQRNLYRNCTVLGLFNYERYIADDKELEEN